MRVCARVCMCICSCVPVCLLFRGRKDKNWNESPSWWQLTWREQTHQGMDCGSSEKERKVTGPKPRTRAGTRKELEGNVDEKQPSPALLPSVLSSCTPPGATGLNHQLSLWTSWQPDGVGVEKQPNRTGPRK